MRYPMSSMVKERATRLSSFGSEIDRAAAGVTAEGDNHGVAPLPSLKPDVWLTVLSSRCPSSGISRNPNPADS
jgi:hypothetical protein